MPPDASQEYGGHRVQRVNLANGATTTLAGSRSGGFREGAGAGARFSYPWGVAIDPTSTFALVGVRRPRISLHHAIPQTIHPLELTDTTIHSPILHTAIGGAHRFPPHYTTQRDQTFGWFSSYYRGAHASQDLGNNRIRRIELATGQTSTLAGGYVRGSRDGVGTNAQFAGANGVVIDPSGTFAMVTVRALLGLHAPHHPADSAHARLQRRP